MEKKKEEAKVQGGVGKKLSIGRDRSKKDHRLSLERKVYRDSVKELGL